MKLKLSLTALLAVTLAFMSPIPAFADGDVACGTSGSYHVTGTVVVSSSNCTGSVVIDDTITVVSSRAFDNQITYYGGANAHANVTSLTLGSHVQEIESNAFRLSVGDLVSLTIPNSVTIIGSSAFYGAGSLTTLNLGTGVTQIGNSAFRGMSSLTRLDLPPMLNRLGTDVFAYSGITSLTIPGSLEVVGYGSLGGLSDLETLVFSEGVKEIEQDAVVYASSLTSLTLPDSLEIIGTFAFLGASSLTEIVIPNGVTDIGDYAFDMIYSLESLTIGSSVRNVGTDMFYVGHLTCFTNLSSLTQMDLLQTDDVIPACAAPQVTPTVVPAPDPYVGPVITGLSTRQANILGGDNLSFYGENLALVTSVLVSGSSVKISSQKNGELSIVLPPHAAGKVSIVMISPSSLFTFENAVEYSSPAAIVQTSTKVLPLSSNKLSALTKDLRLSVSELVKNDWAKSLTCSASYAKGVSKDLDIAKKLATQACALAKAINPKLTTAVVLTLKSAKGKRAITLGLSN